MIVMLSLRAALLGAMLVSCAVPMPPNPEEARPPCDTLAACVAACLSRPDGDVSYRPSCSAAATKYERGAGVPRDPHAALIYEQLAYGPPAPSPSATPPPVDPAATLDAEAVISTACIAPRQLRSAFRQCRQRLGPDATNEALRACVEPVIKSAIAGGDCPQIAIPVVPSSCPPNANCL